MKTETVRESRKWWAVSDNSVIHATGYSCAPSNPDVWWCPEAGYSLTEKFHLFETEKEALEKLIAEIEIEISNKGKTLTNLKARLKEPRDARRVV